MPNPLVQITISLNGSTLSYASSTLVPSGGTAITPVGTSGRRHKIQKGTNIQWICDHDFAVIFSKSPFSSKHTTLSKAQNTPTDPETATKKGNRQKYAVAVFQGGSTPIAAEDPELDISDDGGGGRKKSASKKKKGVARKK